MTLGLGFLVTYYCRTQRQTWGTILGLSVTSLGAFFAFAEYSAFSGRTVVLAGGLWSVAIIVFMFLAFGRDPRILLLIGIPVMILLGIFGYPYSVLLLLEYMALCITTISAYDYSDDSVTARIRNVKGYLGASVRPLSFVRTIVERIVEQPPRGVVAITYFAFLSTFLIVAPLLVAILSNDVIPAGPLIVLGSAYSYLVREAIARSPKPNGANPEK